MNNIYDTQLAISGATLNHVGMLLERQKLEDSGSSVEDGKVTPGDFRDLMGRCHRRTDLMNLFNSSWSRVRGTFDELSALRMEFAARLDLISQDGACGAVRAEMEEA